MSVALKNVKSRNMTTSTAAIGAYTVPGATAAVITSCRVTNTTAGTITVEVSIYDGVNDYFLVKNAEILAGGSLIVCGDSDRDILNTGESVRVKSDTATSCDAVLSVMEYS